MAYSNYQPSVVPSWLQGLRGQQWFIALGTVKDSFVAQLKVAVKSRFPLFASTNAADSTSSGDDLALSAIGSERNLPRYSFDTTASYGQRLLHAWDTWPYAGSFYSILKQLAAAGYTATNGNPACFQQNGVKWALDASGALIRTVLPNANPRIPSSTDGKAAIQALTVPWFTFDGGMDANGNQFCSRFAVIFQSAPTGWNNIQNPPTSNTAPTLSEVNTIKSIINQWKAGKSTCLYVQVNTSNYQWGVNMTWGSFIWGGTSVRWTI